MEPRGEESRLFISEGMKQVKPIERLIMKPRDLD